MSGGVLYLLLGYTCIIQGADSIKTELVGRAVDDAAGFTVGLDMLVNLVRRDGELCISAPIEHIFLIPVDFSELFNDIDCLVRQSDCPSALSFAGLGVGHILVHPCLLSLPFLDNLMPDGKLTCLGVEIVPGKSPGLAYPCDNVGMEQDAEGIGALGEGLDIFSEFLHFLAGIVLFCLCLFREILHDEPAFVQRDRNDGVESDNAVYERLLEDIPKNDKKSLAFEVMLMPAVDALLEAKDQHRLVIKDKRRVVREEEYEL